MTPLVEPQQLIYNEENFSKRIILMTTKTPKSATSVKPHKKKPTWSDVKTAIAKFERPALISLISDL